MTPLPKPEFIGCYSEMGFTPPLAAMQLRWPGTAEGEQVWTLPRGEIVRGGYPMRFGLLIRRQAEDAYAVSLVWDALCRQWFALRRQEISQSSLHGILAALDTRLDYLLEQPIGSPERAFPVAA